MKREFKPGDIITFKALPSRGLHLLRSPPIYLVLNTVDKERVRVYSVQEGECMNLQSQQFKNILEG